jgi:hypothetical protein
MVVFSGGGAQEYLRNHIDFFLINVPTYRPGRELRTRLPALDQRLAELTCYFTFFSCQLPLRHMRYVQSLDAAIAATTKDYCLIQNAGHMFYGQDQLSHDLKAAAEGCTFMTGTIIEGTLGPNCILVNRRAWEKAGRPAFGSPQEGRAGYGWNAVAAGSAAGTPVAPWTDDMRRWLKDFDPYAGRPIELLMNLDDVMNAPPSGDPDFAAMLDFLKKTPNADPNVKSVFVFNSEALADVPPVRFHPGLDSAFMLASGFKTHRLLESLGFHGGTHVIIYDYSPPAVALRRMMVEEWDGVNFGAFFAGTRERLGKMFPGSIVYHPTDITRDPALVEKEFQDEVSGSFENADHWRAHWQKYRVLKHSFVPADILDADAARDLITAHAKGNAVIWISDIFNSPNAVGKLSWERRKLAYDTILESLRTSATADVIIGAAPGLWLVG